MSEAATQTQAEGQVGVPSSGLFSGSAGAGTPMVGTQPEQPKQPEQPQEPTEVEDVHVGEKETPVVTPDASRENEFKYDPTGNASLDYALDFVGQLGFGPNHPAILAAQDGDFHLISAELAREGVRGAEQVIALAKEAYSQETAKAESGRQEVSKFAFEAAGGEANWRQVQSWASANATPQEKAQINQLIAAGGFAAQSAISFLVQQYSKVNTLAKAPAKVASANASSGRGQDVGGALSAAEYGRLVQELVYANGGRDVTGSAEYQSLQQRRLQGRRSGI